MFKVAIVGHSQVRSGPQVDDTEIRIYRVPGARADEFFDQESFNSVLNWEHDLTLLWIGSNDIGEETQPNQLVNIILNIGYVIQENCNSKVIIVEIENRQYQSEHPVISNTRYQKIKRSVNRGLIKSEFYCIHFNALMFTLVPDGVHFSTNAREHINQKMSGVIEEWKETLRG